MIDVSFAALRRAAFVALLCAGAAHAGPPPIPEACDVARKEHFEGAGEAALERYLQWLVQAHGRDFGLAPHEVSLVVVKGEPKPGPVGVTAGEVSCARGDRAPYRIALFREALMGRQVYTVYRTLTHEFTHVLQIRRDRLPCRPSDDTVEWLEREASAVADEIVPACRTAAGQGRSRSAFSR